MQKGRKSKFFLALSSLGGCSWLLFATLHPPLPNQNHPCIFYSTLLHDDLRCLVLRAIDSAKRSITLHIYGLTDPKIIKRLIERQHEGIDVQIFYDRKGTSPLPPSLHATAIKTKGLMHRKILLVDDTLALVGTANFTPSSLKMHGNVIAGLYHPRLTELFTDTNTPPLEQFLASYLLPEEGHDALEKLLVTLQEAKHSIYVAMFTLTHPRIVQELIDAHHRGIKVAVCLDHYTAEGASHKAFEQLKFAGIECRVNPGAELLHHKWALIDGSTFLMGSANWTRAAFESNQDILLIFHSLPPQEQKRLRSLWNRVAFSTKRS